MPSSPESKVKKAYVFTATRLETAPLAHHISMAQTSLRNATERVRGKGAVEVTLAHPLAFELSLVNPLNHGQGHAIEAPIVIKEWNSFRARNLGFAPPHCSLVHGGKSLTPKRIPDPIKWPYRHVLPFECE